MILIQDTPLQEEKTLSLIALIQDGGLGGQIIIGLLFFLLIIVIYIYFERLFAIKSASKISSNFIQIYPYTDPLLFLLSIYTLFFFFCFYIYYQMSY